MLVYAQLSSLPSQLTALKQVMSTFDNGECSLSHTECQILLSINYSFIIPKFAHVLGQANYEIVCNTTIWHDYHNL